MMYCESCDRRFYGHDILIFDNCPYCQSNETRELEE